LPHKLIQGRAPREAFGVRSGEFVLGAQQFEMCPLHLHRRHIAELRATRGGIAEKLRDFDLHLSQ